MSEITFYLQIDKNKDFILTRCKDDYVYDPDVVFPWDKATKLDFTVPLQTVICFKIGSSMPAWFFRDGPKEPTGYPTGKGIYFPKGVDEKTERSPEQGQLKFISQTLRELKIQLLDTENAEPQRDQDGYLKFVLYLTNKQINNKGECAELLYTIDPGGGAGGSKP